MIDFVITITIIIISEADGPELGLSRALAIISLEFGLRLALKLPPLV